jgi:hypothetical protein
MRVLLHAVILLSALCLPDSLAAAPSAEGLIGQSTCDLTFPASPPGLFVPFDKDPDVFLFGDIAASRKRWVVVIRKRTRAAL